MASGTRSKTANKKLAQQIAAQLEDQKGETCVVSVPVKEVSALNEIECNQAYTFDGVVRKCRLPKLANGKCRIHQTYDRPCGKYVKGESPALDIGAFADIVGKYMERFETSERTNVNKDAQIAKIQQDNVKKSTQLSEITTEYTHLMERNVQEKQAAQQAINQLKAQIELQNDELEKLRAELKEAKRKKSRNITVLERRIEHLESVLATTMKRLEFEQQQQQQNAPQNNDDDDEKEGVGTKRKATVAKMKKNDKDNGDVIVEEQEQEHIEKPEMEDL